MRQIIVAQRGWVFVGNVSLDGDNLVITNAQCVRRWGTSAGLGQLALQGPTLSTVLDPCGTVRLHALSVVCRMDCEASKWAAL